MRKCTPNGYLALGPYLTPGEPRRSNVTCTSNAEERTPKRAQCVWRLVYTCTFAEN